MLKEYQQSIENFIEICKNPQAIKQIVLDPKNVNKNSTSPKSVYWNDLSLMDGFPALVVFFATLDQIYPQEKFDLITHRYILEIKDIIEKDGLPQNASLYDGTAGLCCAIAFASKQRTRYSKLLSSLEDILSRQLSEAYIPQIEENLNQKKPINYKFYDAIQGLSGIGLYLIQNNVTEKSNHLIEKLLHLSIQITSPIEYHQHLVPGWLCPAEFLIEKEDQLQNPHGIFNMGLSHGVPSLLGFMSIALKAGIQVPGQVQAMHTIIDWLKSKITKYENVQFFQPRTTFDQQINNMAPTSKNLVNREAWCYGTPGVARTLYLAGIALNDVDTVNFATEAFLSIFERPYEQWKLAGPTFCHGTAGVFLITHLMAKDLQSNFLFSKVNELEKILLNFHDESSAFGFPDLDLCKDKSYYPLDKISLLTGSTGVWLTCLGKQFESIPQWHYPFMIDYA